MKNLHLRGLRFAAGCALAALLAGCGSQELYSQLSERQANEMVAVLRSAGLEADKQTQEGGKGYAVSTSRSDFSLAVRTLSAQGYPREQFDSLGKVFKKEGFVSSPLEERARLVHALSQEISNTIANIDGVVMARVHLVVPERNPLLDKPQRASAAVFIKHRRDKDLAPQTAQIKALVVNSIEGLPYDNVTVALFPAETSLPMQETKVAAAAPGLMNVAGLEMPLMFGAAFGALGLGGGGILLLRRGRSRDEAPQTPRVANGASPEPTLRTPLPPDLQAALRRAASQR